MERRRWVARFAAVLLVIAFWLSRVAGAEDQPWPPPLKGAVNGTATLQTDLFLKVPEAVQAAAQKEGATPFVVAKTPPTVDLAFHGSLPNQALNGTGWSSWGDICVASDGKVYCGIGDHGDDAGGNSYCFIYQWDPQGKILRQVVDMRRVVEPQPGQPTFSKVHARIDEGPDGKVYFSCTLNDGNAAQQPQYKWTDRLPGGQLYQFDPATGQTVVFANLPPVHCTATSLLDRQRNIWWCNLEAGPNGLRAFDLAAGKELYRAPEGSMAFNRNFALASDGAIYFNGPGGRIWKCDGQKKQISPTQSVFPSSAGMRASTGESKDGWVYGSTMGTNQLFRYSPARDRLEMLGTNFAGGEYTTVCALSPDERFVYFCPGAHGGAVGMGTPLVQYEIATGRRKVIAFLREAFEKHFDYVPGGTYGVKLSADGSTLYVNLNGHAGDAIRPKGMGPTGFGLTALAAVHIPAGER